VMVSIVARDTIKPNRIGGPEAGQGTEGGRFADSTEDSGPKKPGNRVEDKTLKTWKVWALQESIGRRTCRQDDGTISSTLCRCGTLPNQGIPNIVIGMWEAVDERRW